LSQNHPYDRRHLKEVLHRDDMMESLLAARDWAKAHLEAVLIGTLVAAAAVFGAVFFVNGQKQKDLEASKLLAEAQMMFQQSGSMPGEQSAQGYGQAYAKYQAVASTYEGSAQAGAARLGMANAQLAQGKAAEAEREYAALDSRDKEDPIAALAAFGKARALEAQGKLPDAQKAYAAAAEAYPASAIAGEAQTAAGRLGAPQKK
jgi:predicted negative regulator of RcsB-dependent stress response